MKGGSCSEGRVSALGFVACVGRSEDTHTEEEEVDGGDDVPGDEGSGESGVLSGESKNLRRTVDGTDDSEDDEQEDGEEESEAGGRLHPLSIRLPLVDNSEDSHCDDVSKDDAEEPDDLHDDFGESKSDDETDDGDDPGEDVARMEERRSEVERADHVDEEVEEVDGVDEPDDSERDTDDEDKADEQCRHCPVPIAR